LQVVTLLKEKSNATAGYALFVTVWLNTTENRDGVVKHDGKLGSLKRFKDDQREVTRGYECGLQLEKFNDIMEGDYLEVYIQEEVKRKL